MEVTFSSKQTGLGLIPKDWDAKCLRDVAQIRSGIAKNANSSVTDPILVHYLRVANVQDGFLDLSEMSQLEISRGDLQRFSVLPGDVLMNEGGDRDKLGRGSIWRGEYQPCVHQNHVFVVRCGQDVVPEFLTIWSAGSTARKFFLLAGKQTTNLASINKTSLGELPVVLPGKKEQQAIAAALSDVDELLGGLDRLIVKKRDLKQAAMQQLLTGQTRLPGFKGEWELVGMRDVLKQNATYGIVTAGTFVRDGVKMLRGGDIVDGRINSDLPMVTREKAAEYTRTTLVKNDVVIALVGYPGASARIPDQLVGANISRAVGLLRPNEKISPDFLVCFLNSSDGRRLVLAPSAGSAQQVVNLAALNKLQFSIPSLGEQIGIAEVISDIDSELAALDQRREKTKALKQAMMQELLTGRIRLV